MTIGQRAAWTGQVFAAAMAKPSDADLRPIRPLVPSDAVILDVGAHTGLWTRAFARMVPRGRVFAVEPLLYPRSVLKGSLRLSTLGNVTLIAQGLLEARGETMMLAPEGMDSDSADLSAAYFAPLPPADPEAETPASLTIPHGYRTLGAHPHTDFDSYVRHRGLQRLDFIRADVEGAELAFVRGAGWAIARFRPVIWLMIDPEKLARFGEVPENLFTYLAPLGYHAMLVDGDEPVEAPVYAGPGSYLFMPEIRSQI